MAGDECNSTMQNVEVRRWAATKGATTIRAEHAIEDRKADVEIEAGHPGRIVMIGMPTRSRGIVLDLHIQWRSDVSNTIVSAH